MTVYGSSIQQIESDPNNHINTFNEHKTDFDQKSLFYFIVPALWLKPPSFRRDRFQRAADLALWYELSRWQPYQI
jgi:hypothetical protein